MSIKLPEATYTDPDQVIAVANAAKVLVEAFPDFDIAFNRRGHQELVSSEVDSVVRQIRRGKTNKRSKGFRSTVIECVKDKHQTVQQVCDETGLEPSRVRGVLNAPTLTFDKKVENGVTAYKFVSVDKAPQTGD